MAEEKPLTMHDLMAVLQTLPTKDEVQQIVAQEIDARGLATKDDVRQIVAEEIDARNLATKDMVTDAVDTVLVGVEQMFKERDQRLDRIEREVRGIGRRLSSLEADTPTREEFDTLRDKVERYLQ